VRNLAVLEGRPLTAATTHGVSQPIDTVSVLAVLAQVRAVHEPVGAVPRTGSLYVRRLLARLPSAGDDKSPGHGCTLGAVNVLRIAEADPREIVPLKSASMPGGVELDQHRAGLGDLDYLAKAAVLDALLARSVMLADHRNAIAVTDTVRNTRNLDLPLTKFAALGAVVLSPRVQTSDLLVRGVRDQGDLGDRNRLRERRPGCDSALD